MRYDVTAIKAVKTDEGFILDKPVIGRSGILTYMNSDGTKRLEYRPPEEAFDEKSLASIRGKPIMIGHAAMANSGNAGNLPIVGSVLSGGQKDGNAIRADVSIYRLPTDARELSCGYKLDLDETPGITPDGQHYDAIQRNIRYNHLAIVPKGRAGVARLNMDGDQDISFAEYMDGSDLTTAERNKLPKSAFGLPDKMAYPMPDAGHAANAKARAAQELKSGNLTQEEYDIIVKKANVILNQKRGDSKMAKVRLDTGIEYEVPAEVQAYIDQHRADGIKGKASMEALQAKYDTLSTAHEKFKQDTEKTIKDMKDNFDGAVKSRIDLLSVADAAGIKKADSMTDKEIRIAVIKNVNGDGFDVESKSDDYINAAFDMCKSMAKKNDDSNSKNRQKMNNHDGDDSHVDEFDYLAKLDKIREDEAKAYLGGEK